MRRLGSCPPRSLGRADAKARIEPWVQPTAAAQIAATLPMIRSGEYETRGTPDSIPFAARPCRMRAQNSELTPTVEKIYWHRDGDVRGFVRRAVTQPPVGFASRRRRCSEPRRRRPQRASSRPAATSEITNSLSGRDRIGGARNARAIVPTDAKTRAVKEKRESNSTAGIGGQPAPAEQSRRTPWPTMG